MFLFSIWWILRKFAFFCLFLVFLMKDFRWPPLKSTEKNCYDVLKIGCKDLSSFSSKCKKPSQSWSSWGGRNRVITILNIIILIMAEVPQISISNKRKKYSFQLKCRKHWFSIWKKIYFFQIWRSHFGDPLGTAFQTILSVKDILRQKTWAIRNSKN